MSSTQQGSNDWDHPKIMKPDKSTRRSWSPKEEEVLLTALKELIAQGLKSDNGFKTGYLGRLEDAIKKEFPSTNLKANPHINSKVSTWKRNYSSLTTMLSRTGVGFNTETHTIDCTNEQWEQIVKSDPNAKAMRYKPWPMFESWKEIFGKDRANGDNAEDVLDAVNELFQMENTAHGGVDGDYYVNLDDIDQTKVSEETSVCQETVAAKKPAGKKRKAAVYDDARLVEMLGESIHSTNARLDNIASRMGYEFDLGEMKKDAFEKLGTIPGLSLENKFDVCEIFAEKTDRLLVFMGLPDSAKPQYVERLLKTKPM